MIKTCLKQLHDIASRGDAREESFYAPLSELLAEYARQVKLNKVQITTLPKQTEAGNPDCRVVTALSLTIEAQREIDTLYGEIEKDTIEIRNGGIGV